MCVLHTGVILETRLRTETVRGSARSDPRPPRTARRPDDSGIPAFPTRTLLSRRGVIDTGVVTDLLALCADLPTEAVPAGGVLIETGAVTSRMYVLASGSVTIERDGVAFARIDNPGAIFGEMSVVLDQPASATVRASSDVEVHVIEEPEEFLIAQPGAAYAILRTTASRLDGLTRYLVDVKQQFADEEGHLGMVGQILDTLVHHQAAPVRPGSVRDPEG
jgi:CRP/FNR family transcriptional regulator, cyclic AMP receptor protein